MCEIKVAELILKSLGNCGVDFEEILTDNKISLGVIRKLCNTLSDKEVWS